MKTAILDRELIERLTQPGPRLPGIGDWLLNSVWTQAAFEAAGSSPQAYLLQGEAMVNGRENLLRTAASSLIGELASAPPFPVKQSILSPTVLEWDCR